MRTSRRHIPRLAPHTSLTPAALKAMSDQVARWSGWPDAATRLEALRDLESIGDSYVDSRLSHGLAVESADVIRQVIVDALLEQTRTTRGPHEIPGRLIQLAADASRRSYARAESRVAHQQQLAAAGDATADELAERILADLRETEAARRADQAHDHAEIEAA